MGTEKRNRQKQGRQARMEAVAEQERKLRQRRTAIRVGILGLIAAVVVVLVMVLGGGDDGEQTAADDVETVTPAVVDPPEPGETLTEPAECPPTDGSAPRVTTFTIDGLPDCLDPDAAYSAVITTNLGEMTVDLDPSTDAEALNVFVTLARYGYYDGSAIYGTDPGTGTIAGGAPHSNAVNDLGPGFEVPVESGTAAPVGSLVLDLNARFRIVALATAVESRGGSVIGTLDNEALGVANSILGLHAEAPGSLLSGAGPSQPVVVESISIVES
ncbi:MAG: hypothetical protein KDB21_12210 [Acidimicrobiales bacterium]|nr:hypothetical protein [Acidimicrobiales bacterium]